MERMKIEIEKSEYDRLKSREEKLMAYYEWFVDKKNDLVTVEDVVNKNIKLEKENRILKEEISKYNEIEEHIEDGLLTPIPNAWSHEEEIKRLKIENKKLKDKLSEITIVADDEKQSIEHILELEEENKKLREENKKLQNDLETVAGAYFDR